MSVHVLLLPRGVAPRGDRPLVRVVSASELPPGARLLTPLEASRTRDLSEKYKPTRALDQQLLREALARMGATIAEEAPDRILATGPWGRLTFQTRADAIYGRADGGGEDVTHTVVEELDRQVGLIAQSRTAALVRERAQELGFRLVEQHDENGTFNYVFEEQA